MIGMGVYLSVYKIQIFGEFPVLNKWKVTTKICFRLISVQSEPRKRMETNSEMTKPDTPL